MDKIEKSLKIVCPNCHSQTDTYGLGKDRKADKKKASHWWKKWSVSDEIKPE